MSSNTREHAIAFMTTMGSAVRDTPGLCEEGILRRRMQHLVSEVFEALCEVVPSAKDVLDRHGESVCTLLEYVNLDVNLPNLARELCDIDLIVEGTRCALGIDGDLVEEEVHRANMQKERREGKIIKPPGWKAPDIYQVLKKKGYVR